MSKKQESKVIWIIISSDGFEGSYKTFNLAKERAEDMLEYGVKDNIQILEVVKAWQVVFPAEPTPETLTMKLDDVDA